MMLLTVVVLWALNFTVTRYMLTHGFHPLAYATVRYGAAAADLRRDRARRRAVAPDARAPTSGSSSSRRCASG